MAKDTTASQKAIAKGILEFSKLITVGLLLLFAIQVISSEIIIALNIAVADKIIDFMKACISVYITGLAGYSAKAGIENALKILNDTKQLTQETSTTENG